MAKQRKGIILAGGSGTRLWPSTLAVSKQLLPIYDKPMVYYPLSTLMLARITEILVITTTHEMDLFKRLLGDGSYWGLKFSYASQSEPKGVAEALTIGERFLDGHPSALILGDNIFFGAGFSELLPKISNERLPAVNFAAYVDNPNAYGVCEFNENGSPKRLIEKPKKFFSNWAITGLYFYDEHAPQIAKTLKPSKRGEYEITDVNTAYLTNNTLTVKKLQRGVTWMDAGNHSSLLEASNFVSAIEHRQGLKLGCPEEIAYRMRYIDRTQFCSLINHCKNEAYAQYLRTILD